MKARTGNLENSETIALRAAELFRQHQQVNCKRTDRMFAILLPLQWIAGIVAAYWISPLTWIGTASQTHLHVWAALFLGGAISSLPFVLTLKQPGSLSTRYTVAVAQMLMGALLIHLTGGRI
jgi:hypothetical protein